MKRWKILPVKLDNMAHDLINGNDMDIVEWIVMTIFDLSYQDVHGNCSVQNIRLTRTNPTDKNKYVDFLFKYKDNYLILEFNNHFDGSIVRNIVFGMTKAVSYYQMDVDKNSTKDEWNLNDKVNKDKDFSYYEKVIRISVVNLNWYRSKKDIPTKKKDVHRLYAFDNPNKGIFFEVINIALDKYANVPYNKVKKCDKFYKLLTIQSMKLLNMFKRDEPLLEKYFNKLVRLSNEEINKEGLMNWSTAIDRKIERAVAYTEGIEQKEREVVLAMNKENESLEKICKYSKLSIEKVKEIIKSAGNKEKVAS